MGRTRAVRLHAGRQVATKPPANGPGDAANGRVDVPEGAGQESDVTEARAKALEQEGEGAGDEIYERNGGDMAPSIFGTGTGSG
jgi:hypothetical protein